MYFVIESSGKLGQAKVRLAKDEDVTGVIVERNTGVYWNHIAVRPEEADDVLAFVEERGISHARKVDDPGLLIVSQISANELVEILNKPEEDNS